MRDILHDFKFVPDGATNLVDALCRFIKEEITFGRITGGEKLPTISEMCKSTGLTFAQARRVTECLAREGYVCSRPHVGTVVLSRGDNVLRGRVLFILPDEDVGRYHPSQLIDIVGRRLTASGYSFSVASFSRDANDRLAFLKSELLRATDLVIAIRASPQVQKVLAESGVNHFFVYGDKPESDDRPWIRFSPEEAISQFADHCQKAGVKHVVQVRFEGGETLDAQPALTERGIYCSWMDISRSKAGWGRFDGIVHCGYETFAAMPRTSIPEIFLFWNSFFTQGAIMAFLSHGIIIPEEVKIVTLSNTGVGPVYIKPFTRFEINPADAGQKIGDFALSILTRGRIPRPPQIKPRYVIGETFPF
ncbi:MAG: substrate-binding domain-containing protein [Kiritimatiellae bacterium]|nr:substrate-binding domain-containing protein [Kiritimatiellia bacterium]